MSPAAKKHPSPSQNGVFERLLSDIVSGRYPAGARLPAERELAVKLGASRPTLREALRRLGEWRLVEARRGSGVVVREQRDWSLDVLPAYVRLGAAARGPDEVARLVVDLLSVRKIFLVDVLKIVAPRLGAQALSPARDAVRRAWEARADHARFVREDFEVVRALTGAAGFLPAMWLLNDLSGVYLELAGTLAFALAPPDDYLATYEEVFAALERGDAATASARMVAYLDGHDRRLLSALGIAS